MKNLIHYPGVKLICFIIFFITSASSYAQFEDKLALFIVADDAALNAGEEKIFTRLSDLGFEVVAINQNNIGEGSADGFSLVLVSATVSSGTVSGNMAELTVLEVPVIIWEPFLYDFMGFQELDGGEFPVTDTTNIITIINDTHPLAGGLSAGSAMLSDTSLNVSYGRPQGDVVIIAVNSADTTQVVLFGYDTGAAMFSGNAPARRVGSFLLNDAANYLNEDGWKVFDASIFWAMNADPVAVENSDKLPGQFILHDNYPNPFNPSTTIAYSIPAQSNVNLSIFNTLGEKVITLIDEIKPAGNYKVNFNSAGIPSGVYLYRFEAGVYSIAKKMILLK